MERFAQDTAALDAKFNAIDLSDALAAQTLVSATGIAKARTKVESYRALVRQRLSNVEQYLDRIEREINAAEFTTAERQRLLNEHGATKRETLEQYRQLDSAQMASMTTLEAILDFAVSVLGTTQIGNGQLLFSRQQDLDNYQRLYAEFTIDAQREAEAIKRISEYSTQQRKKMVQIYQQ